MAKQPRSAAAPRRRARPRLEELEPRQLPSASSPTVLEQVFLEQLNDARANPAAYGAAIGLDLSNVAAAQPLAFNPYLIQAAQGHAQDMSARSFFAHTNPGGQGPGARITAAGFNWTSYGESIAAGYASSAAALSALIIDAGVPNLGHRLHLLAMNNSDKQVGVGVLLNGSGAYRNYYAIDTANSSDGRPFLTGVVYNDANANGRYDAGEGLGGATITVSGVGTVATWGTGGYSFQVGPGTYTVTASGGGLPAPITRVVTVSVTNLRLNFTAAGASVTGAMPARVGWAARVFSHSPENYSNFIAQTYQKYLGRTPDGPGLSFWVVQMLGGLSDERLEAFFIGSPEYIANHGGTSGAWVTGMYYDLLGRIPASQEVSYWLGRMAGGMTPGQVALGFAASAEREGLRVQDIYRTLLGRTAAPAEVAFWVDYFLRGASNEDVVAGFVGSQEYFQSPAKGNGGVADWVRSAYRDVLHRNAGNDEVSFWVTQM